MMAVPPAIMVVGGRHRAALLERESARHVLFDRHGEASVEAAKAGLLRT